VTFALNQIDFRIPPTRQLAPLQVLNLNIAAFDPQTARFRVHLVIFDRQTHFNLAFDIQEL
jgi:hypothetical protein